MGIKSGRTPTVSAAAFRGNEVLLVKHGEAASHLTGVYGLPGGRLEEGESLLDAAAREFEEETGLTAERDSMKEISTVFNGDIQRKSGEILETAWHVFGIQNFTGELRETDETSPEWVEIETMASLNLLPNTEVAVLEALSIIEKI
jgi:ADP-ribose pyrophosphatase YjhB (NUDIX family)